MRNFFVYISGPYLEGNLTKHQFFQFSSILVIFGLYIFRMWGIYLVKKFLVRRETFLYISRLYLEENLTTHQFFNFLQYLSHIDSIYLECVVYIYSKSFFYYDKLFCIYIRSIS